MIIGKNNTKINYTYCNSFFIRLKGFMFKFKIDKCLIFPKCSSIHTFFMFKSIDVIMTDKKYNILYIYKSLKPFRIILPKKNVYYTFEFPNNFTNYKIKEKIKFE